MKKNLKIWIALVVLVLLIAIAAIVVHYQRIDERSAKLILVQYFVAWQKGDPEQMYKFLSADEQAVLSKSAYIKQYDELPVQLAGYVVNDIHISGKTAQAKVILSWPELELDSAEDKAETFILRKEKNIWKIREQDSLAD